MQQKKWQPEYSRQRPILNYHPLRSRGHVSSAPWLLNLIYPGPNFGSGVKVQQPNFHSSWASEVSSPAAKPQPQTFSGKNHFPQLPFSKLDPETVEKVRQQLRPTKFRSGSSALGGMTRLLVFSIQCFSNSFVLKQPHKIFPFEHFWLKRGHHTEVY